MGCYGGWRATWRLRQADVTSWSLLYFQEPKSKCGLHPWKHSKLYVAIVTHGSLLKSYHDHPTAGYLDIANTLTCLGLRFFWPNLASGAKTYVATCAVCQISKPSERKPVGLMVPIHPKKGPWGYTGVDYVGPLLCSQSFP